jgi:hypothetical protein
MSKNYYLFDRFISFYFVIFNLFNTTKKILLVKSLSNQRLQNKMNYDFVANVLTVYIANWLWSVAGLNMLLYFSLLLLFKVVFRAFLM